MSKTDELRKSIEEQQKMLEQLQKEEKILNRKNAIKDLSEFTDDEKIKIFNKLYNSALTMLNEKEGEDYCEDNDDDHYTWEEVMGILARDKKTFWNYFNSL